VRSGWLLAELVGMSPRLSRKKKIRRYKICDISQVRVPGFVEKVEERQKEPLVEDSDQE